MIVNWGDIYEVIYLCEADTVVASAFRKAVGLPVRHRGGRRVAYDRAAMDESVDYERLMGQRYGVVL